MAKLLCLVFCSSLALFALAPTASAGDCDNGHGHHHGRVTCNSSGTCHVRDRHHPSTRYVIPRHNRGARYYGGDGRCRTTRGYRRPRYGPFSELRPFLHGGRAAIRARYVRHYFLRRHPFAATPGTAIEETCAVGTLLAIGDTEAGSERALDTAGRLDRGTARFHVAEYDRAREDFRAVLSATPKDVRARLGLLMVAVVKSEWSAAARELDTLAAAGELRADDRFELDSTFADSGTLAAITAGLKSTVGYRLEDARAHLVTSWLFAAQGDASAAKRFVRLAKRHGQPTAAVQAMEVNLGMVKAAAPKAAPPVTPKRDVMTPNREIRAPNPALHRQIAATSRKGA